MLDVKLSFDYICSVLNSFDELIGPVRASGSALRAFAYRGPKTNEVIKILASLPEVKSLEHELSSNSYLELSYNVFYGESKFYYGDQILPWDAKAYRYGPFILRDVHLGAEMLINITNTLFKTELERLMYPLPDIEVQ